MRIYESLPAGRQGILMIRIKYIRIRIIGIEGLNV